MNRNCFECRSGEHENYDEDIRMTLVRDPETKKIYRRGWMCKNHRMMYDDDGYSVEM